MIEVIGTVTTAVCMGGQRPAAGNLYAGVASYHAHGAIEQMQFGNLLWEYADYNSRLQPVDLRLGTTAQGWEKWRLRNTYAVSCGGGERNNGNAQSQTVTVGGTLELAQTYG
ncbi:MAG: hypothetical protein KIT09_00715 [Bryobacteraceae bacterium]|nr:hypothetical protein [Bryobacteraceae bacterium]